MTVSIQYSTMREQIEIFLRCIFRQIFENMSSDYILVVQFFLQCLRVQYIGFLEECFSREFISENDNFGVLLPIRESGPPLI